MYLSSKMNKCLSLIFPFSKGEVPFVPFPSSLPISLIPQRQQHQFGTNLVHVAMLLLDIFIAKNNIWHQYFKSLQIGSY